MKSIRPWKVELVLICVWGVFLSACGTTSSPASGSSQPCIPSTPGANPYKSEILPQVSEVYSRSFANLSGVRNEAFTLLVDQVLRWSATVDIPVDNGNNIRITITYISPELMQLIILNHQLNKNTLPAIDAFEQILQNRMYEVAGREELIFLMTITYSNYGSPTIPEINRVTLKIPMGELALVNSRNRRIPAYNIDPHLRQEIVASQGPISGYLAFPIGVGSPENCALALEDKWNTIINVNIPRVTINGTDYAHPLAWSITYHSLVDMENGRITPNVPDATLQSGVPIDYQPPPPRRGVPVESEVPSYWELMALHVWGYVTGP